MKRTIKYRKVNCLFHQWSWIHREPTWLTRSLLSIQMIMTSFLILPRREPILNELLVKLVSRMLNKWRRCKLRMRLVSAYVTWKFTNLWSLREEHRFQLPKTQQWTTQQWMVTILILTQQWITQTEWTTQQWTIPMWIEWTTQQWTTQQWTIEWTTQ